jgi:hypothetical protein
MVESFADWLCNLLLWTAVVSLLVLLYETLVSPGFLHPHLVGIIAVSIVVVLSMRPKH